MHIQGGHAVYLFLLGKDILWVAVGGVQDQIHCPAHPLQALLLLHALMTPASHNAEDMSPLGVRWCKKSTMACCCGSDLVDGQHDVDLPICRQLHSQKALTVRRNLVDNSMHLAVALLSKVLDADMHCGKCRTKYTVL